MATLRGGRFVNWGRNQTCTPAEVVRPATEGEICEVVARAAAAGRVVRVVGAGHSFSDCVLTPDVLVVLDRYDAVLRVDREAKQVTVQAGMRLSALNAVLRTLGLALPNLGDIAYQTVSGAISTGTHGTGSRLGGIATAVAGLTLVAADGSVVACSAAEDPVLFDCARVSLGALGILSTITFQCVDAFRLRAVEQTVRLDEVLESFDALMDGNEHMEFYWVPHTRWALTKRNNRTDDPVDRSALQALLAETVLENVAFGAVVKAGKVSPRLGRRVAKVLPSGAASSTYVDESARVFTSPRLVRFVEMEYSIPRAECVGVLRELVAWHERNRLPVSFPVEVRTVAADDLPLSTASGRDSAYLAVHMAKGVPYERWFRVHESLCKAVGGRPHWGKLHWLDAEDLAPRYPRWHEFQAQRARLDPAGTFANDHVRRVLGPVAPG